MSYYINYNIYIIYKEYVNAVKTLSASVHANNIFTNRNRK
jgi:hypothetical protein